MTPGVPVRIAVRAFRAVTRVLPPESRAELLPAVHDDATERFDEAVRRGWAVLLGTWLAVCVDTLRQAPGEWKRVRRAPSRRSSEGGVERMKTMTRNLKRAGRSLLKRPGFTMVAAVTLSLGIGANLAIFAVVHGVLIRPLPFPDSERIVSVRHHAPGLDLPELESSEGMFGFYAANGGDVFEALGGLNQVDANLTGLDAADRVGLVEASPEVFDVLRLQPLLGRNFTQADVRGEAARVLILTETAWRTRFDADPGVLGSTLSLDDEPYEIVGVADAAFETVRPDRFALRPLRIDPEGQWGAFGLMSIGRFRGEFDVAERRVQEIQSRLADHVPSLSQEFLDQAGWTVTFEPLRERMVSGIAEALWLILGTVGVVFLIACANVANLFLVRAEDRQREVAVHTALGADRRTIGSLVLSESLLLGLIGGALGIGLATAAVTALQTLAEGSIPRLAEVEVGSVVVALSLLLSVAAGLLFGALSFVRLARTEPTGVLRDGGMNATVTRDRRTARNGLVAAQMSLALMLLIGAGLMIRSVDRMMAVDPGFDPDGVLSVLVSGGAGFDTEEAVAFYRAAIERLGALPGVTAAGATNSLPLAQQTGFAGSVELESFPRSDDDMPQVSARKAITHGYFEAMGIAILQGRSTRPFEATPEDGSPPVWVNQEFVDVYLQGRAPIGERIAVDDREDPLWMEIVGVVGNNREWALTDPHAPMIHMHMSAYGELGLSALGGMAVQLRTTLDPTGLVGPVRAAIAGIDEDVPVTAVTTLDEIVSRSMRTTTFTMALLGLAAGIALLLGAVGLFGVISYVVSRRTREIGVRVALGAGAGDVQRMVVGQGLLVTGAGIVVGVLGAWGLSSVMESVLFEVSARDPLAFTIAPAVLLAVSVFASWLPARRASRVDPLVALKSD